MLLIVSHEIHSCILSSFYSLQGLLLRMSSGSSCICTFPSQKSQYASPFFGSKGSNGTRPASEQHSQQQNQCVVRAAMASKEASLSQVQVQVIVVENRRCEHADIQSAAMSGYCVPEDDEQAAAAPSPEEAASAKKDFQG